MRNESALTVRFKADIILVMLLVLILGLVVIAHHPFEMTSEDAHAHAMMPPQMGMGEAVLVLPSTSEVASTFDALDFSFAWYNLMTQEIGPFSIALASEVTAETFSEMRLIVIPRKTAQTMSEAQIELVENAVTHGASLVVEMPTPAWSSLTSVKRKAQANSAIRHFTDAPNSPLTESLRDALLNFPLATQIMRIDALDNETLAVSDQLLEIDGAIVHYHRVHGAGHVFVLAFDMGQALTALEQGRPNDDFSLEPAEEGALTTTADLVLHEKLKTNFIPYAEILKRHVLFSIWRFSPQATLWPFPNAEKSALILTHDAAHIGDAAQYIIEDEQKNNVVSTLIASTENTSGSWLNTVPAKGHEVGALLMRPPVGQSWRQIGPDFFAPVRVERNLAAQRNLIAQRTRKNVTTCRKLAQVWQHDYITSFKELTAAKCQIDLSYVPADAQYGYLFGTGFPFLPMDRGGLPFPIYELPTLMTDSSSTAIDPQNAVKLLRESNDLYHEPIVLNFSADTMREHPHYQAIDAWQQVIEYAHQNHIRLATVQDYMQYFSIRKQAAIRSSFNEASKVLSISLDLPESANAYTVAVPTRTVFGAIQNLTLDQKPCDNKFQATSGLQTLVAVPPGAHQLDVVY